MVSIAYVASQVLQGFESSDLLMHRALPLQGFVVIPKSVKKERIVDNANVFDFNLEKEDIEYLTTLDEFLITVSSR